MRSLRILFDVTIIGFSGGLIAALIAALIRVLILYPGELSKEEFMLSLFVPAFAFGAVGFLQGLSMINFWSRLFDVFINTVYLISSMFRRR